MKRRMEGGKGGAHKFGLSIPHPEAPLWHAVKLKGFEHRQTPKAKAPIFRYLTAAFLKCGSSAHHAAQAYLTADFRRGQDCSTGVMHQQATHRWPKATRRIAGTYSRKPLNSARLLFAPAPPHCPPLPLPRPIVLFLCSSFLMTHKSYRIFNSEGTLEITPKGTASFLNE